MEYYHLSYDLRNVEPGENDHALEGLIDLIMLKLGGEVLNRPVRSTLIFSSVLSFEEVRKIFFSWSREVGAFYVLSGIKISPAGETFCRLVSNQELEEGLVAKVKEKNDR